MTQVWAGSRHKGGALILMLALADFAHDDGTNAYPSIPTLARKTRMSPRQVQRVIQQCEQSGELIAARSTDGLHSTRYTIVLDALNVRGVKMSPPSNRAWRGDAGVTRTVREPSGTSTTKEEAERLWLAALEQLRGSMNQSNYTTYVDGSAGLRLENGVLIVQARPSQVEALTTRFAPLVRRVLGERSFRFEVG